MKQFDLINSILDLLRQGEQTISSLNNSLGKSVPDQQIRRTLEEMRGLNLGVEIEEKTGRANKRSWFIKTSSYEMNTRRLLQGVTPRVFTNVRNAVVEKIVGLPTDFVESSHFYETEAYEVLDTKLEQILQAIETQKKLRIKALTGDATSVAGYVVNPIVVSPVKIIYHRGCFYVAVVEEVSQRVLTFQVEQLLMEPTDEAFDRACLIDIVDQNLKIRFGISQNRDEYVYTIRLQFSSITGEFIRKQFWHNDLPDPVQEGDNWLFSFECGINRELVGWLFQWMSNVKVLGPPELITLYNEQLDQMIAIRSSPDDAPLEYTNRFAPRP
jgi:predicted DNA-binding transcriptional regulator YafY